MRLQALTHACPFRPLGKLAAISEQGLPVAHTAEINSVGTMRFQVGIATGAERGSKMLMALDRGSCSVGPGTRQAVSANPQSRLKARMVPCEGLKEGEVACSESDALHPTRMKLMIHGNPAAHPVVLPCSVCRVSRPDLPNRRARDPHCEQARLIHCAFLQPTGNTHS